jgi:hypothetical protein
MSAISPELLPSIKQQNKIGWHQIFKGRIAKKIIQFMEAHYRTLPIDTKRYTGERWGKMLISNIWHMVLTLWSNRNEVVHGNRIQAGLNTEKQRLHHRVQQYYERKETLSTTNKEKIFYKDVQDMLQEDSRYIKAWLKIAQRVFSAHRKEQSKPQHEQKLMEAYFGWKPSQTTTRRKAKDPRAPDETHPD